MILFPAIDLLGGRAVRLRAGSFDDVTVYHERPWELARDLARGGASALHVVDLDAVRALPPCVDVLARIRDAAPQLRMQVGGGLRSIEAVHRALAAGADRAVVGTLAVRTPNDAAALCRAHPGRIVVAVDSKDGTVAVAGWTEPTQDSPLSLARRAAQWGAAAVLYTDVARDGLEKGPDLDTTSALAKGADVPLIASGGVASVADLRALAAIRPRIEGTVVGRALLEGRFSLAEALGACR